MSRAADTRANLVPAEKLLAPQFADDAAQSRGPLHPLAIWRRLRRDKAALVGLGMACTFLIIALFAPIVARHNPEAKDLARMNEPPSWMKYEPLVAPGETPDPEDVARASTDRRVFGRDVRGRDILSRVIYGARTSIFVGLFVVSIACMIGVTAGSLAGYVGGVVDSLIMRAVDIMLAFPFLILAIAIVSIFPQTTIYHIAVVLGLTMWPGMSRLMRAQVLTTRDLEFVKAAQALGAGHFTIITRHILPNCIGPIVIWYTMGIAGAIMAEASLSFLGLGPEDSLSWGSMIDNGLKKSNFPAEWWPVMFPAGALALLVLGFNLLGDGLQDAINPKLKK